MASESDGKFRARCRATGRWVSGVAFRTGHSDRIDLTPEREESHVFAPDMRGYFEAWPKTFEVVEEPTP